MVFSSPVPGLGVLRGQCLVCSEGSQWRRAVPGRAQGHSDTSSRAGAVAAPGISPPEPSAAEWAEIPAVLTDLRWPGQHERQGPRQTKGEK